MENIQESRILTREDLFREMDLYHQRMLELREKERKEEAAKREAERKEREAERKELEAQAAKSKDDLEKQIKRVDKQIGELGNRLGAWVQSAIRPNIMELFTNLNISDYFENYSYKLDGKRIYETDIVLLNEGALVVVEVKSSPSISDVDEHIIRLGRFIEYPPRHILVDGCKVYGAIAGMILDEKVIEYAESKGMYVIKPHLYDICLANDADFVPKDYRY